MADAKWRVVEQIDGDWHLEEFQSGEWEWITSFSTHELALKGIQRLAGINLKTFFYDADGNQIDG